MDLLDWMDDVEHDIGKLKAKNKSEWQQVIEETKLLYRTLKFWREKIVFPNHRSLLRGKECQGIHFPFFPNFKKRSSKQIKKKKATKQL